MQKYFLIWILCSCVIPTRIEIANAAGTGGDDQPKSSGLHDANTEDKKVNDDNQDQSNRPESSNKPDTFEKQQQSNKQIQEYEPFIVTSSLSSMTYGRPWDYHLPFMFIKKDNELKLIGQADNLRAYSLCPDVRKDDKEWQRKLSVLQDRVPATVGCLFLAWPFEENEKQKCTKEPQPWLGNQRLINGKLAHCGTGKHQRMISSEYYNCGSYSYVTNYVDRSEKAETERSNNIPGFSPEHYIMYEICYDFSNMKTLWTKHVILSPPLFAHKDYLDPGNSLNDFQLKDFSTEVFRLEINKATFINLKNAYELAKDSTSIYTMVPKAHMAMPYWKKSTMHLINSAPLLPKFLSLMEAIHNGIFLASYQLQLESPNETLEIYTKADTVISKMHALATNIPLVKHVISKKLDEIFHSNTWYILVRNKKKNSGIVIILHNTREVPPKKECDNTLPCNFRDWSDTPNLISDDHLEYAYCCPISQQLLAMFENEESPIYENFDIQAKILQRKNSM